MIDRIILFAKTRSERHLLLLLLGMGFIPRLYAVLMAKGIANDSASYGFMARDFLAGDFLKALSPAFHPLYPYLISLLSPDATHVEITGRLISLFFGTFALIPLFYLTKEAFGRKEALLIGLFYCFHPSLVTFSGMFLTEATYWAFLILSVTFLRAGLRKKKILASLMAPIFLALAYLTRPEGMGYLFVFLVWVATDGGVKKGWFRKIGVMAGLVLVFFVVSGPYFIYIRQETGRWLISKKAIEGQTWLMALNKGGRKPAGIKVPEEGAPPKNTFRLTGQVKTFLRFLPSTTYHYLRAYHFTLWLFLLFGLIRVRAKGAGEEWFFASFVLFHILSLATFVPSTTRFSVPLVPLSLFWAALGAFELSRFLEKRGIARPERRVFYLVVLILVVQLAEGAKPERRHREDQRVVGLWLNQNAPPGALIMSNSPQEAFYANRPFVWMPPGVTAPGRRGPSYQDVLTFAREKGVRYILIDRNSSKFSADFVNSIPSPEVREIYRYQDRKGDITLVYEVLK